MGGSNNLLEKQFTQNSFLITPVVISEKGWVIACSPSWYLTWLFLSFPTFGYLIKYLTELKIQVIYHLGLQAITQPFSEIPTGMSVPSLKVKKKIVLIASETK